VKLQDQQVAAAAIVEDGSWLGRIQDELRALLAPVFCQARSRLAAFGYIGALLAAGGGRRSCWQLAEAAGHATPRRMQALLAGHAWDWRAALTALQRFILDHLGDPGAVLVLDETAELKQGQMTVGVARQHAGITGQVENCQTVVFMAYVTARAHALFDFRLYLPKRWCADRERRERAQVPHDIRFATKTELGTEMVTGAIGAGVPFGFVAGDEVYGRSSRLRAACEQDGKGYAFAVPVNFQVRLPSGRKAAVASLARLAPRTAWEMRSCRPGCKGHRDYDWAWAATASPRHWLLIRRSLSDPSDLAFFYCHVPAGCPLSLSLLIKICGQRWPVEIGHR
jgi:SRSO17 transposase